MSLRQYLSIMIFSTILCWIAWGMILVTVDPFQTTSTGFIFFYASLFLALIGSGSLLTFFLYKIFSRTGEPLFRYVQKSFRDGFLAATLVVVMLALQGGGLLRWWNAALCAGTIGIGVAFRLSSRRADENESSTEIISL